MMNYFSWIAEGGRWDELNCVQQGPVQTEQESNVRAG